MKIINLKSNSSQNLNNVAEVINRGQQIYSDISNIVDNIIADVRDNGDKAVIKYTNKFDCANLQSLLVNREEILEAYSLIPKDFLPAITQAIDNQRIFQSSLLELKSETIQTEKGIKLWREWRPIESVGLYVPGGRANYPSSIVMVVVPAQISGCREIVICTPPNQDGKINPAVLVTANELGVSKIYKVGGAQAIAAMAYGTETIPKTYKVFGAGNSFVTLAKIKVFGDVAIDMPAGPSEIMVVADKTANYKYVAADMISQCEHGVESSAVLVTDCEELASQVEQECYRQAKSLSSFDTINMSLRNYGAIIIVNEINDAINIVNDFAPEHLEIITKDAYNFAKNINNAGSIFLGQYSSEPAGDYASGSNHVLPTNKYAKMFEGLSINSFGKWIEFQELSKDGLASIKDTINVLAKVENLPAHANSINIRFEE
jgi:histidinol dehydrogenase